MPIIDACTLCDGCFERCALTGPDPDQALDLPHVILRARAAELASGHRDPMRQRLAKVDRNGRWLSLFAPLSNWVTARDNKKTRRLLQKLTGIDTAAELPKFQRTSFLKQAARTPHHPNAHGCAFGRKAILYATCSVNYSNRSVGIAALEVLAMNGVLVETAYPACCGRAQFERGDLSKVAKQAEKISGALKAQVEAGATLLSLNPSCTFMLTSVWPRLLPLNEDVKQLAKATRDITDYLLDIAQDKGLTPGMRPLDGDIALHLASHAKAQSGGSKVKDLLSLIPQAEVHVIDGGCPLGGAFGVLKDQHETVMKMGRATMRRIVRQDAHYLACECPQAAIKLMQGIEEMTEPNNRPNGPFHPIELIAKAYGLD
jgi:glycerol-3-phosphate dehydrogenase subunit C